MAEKKASKDKTAPVANEAAVKSLIAAARTLLPFAESYGRSREAEAAAAAASGEPAPTRPITTGGADKLSDDERKAFGMAVSRLVAEGAELILAGGTQDASGKLVEVNYDTTTGRYPTPSLAHLIAAVGRLRNPTQARSQAPMVMQPMAPGQPQTIISAMQMASPAAGQAPAMATPMMMMMAPQPVASIRRGAFMEVSPSAVSAPATVVQSTQGCQCSSSTAAPIATRKADGTCEPDPFEISCETQIRIKQCLLEVICDFLRCLDRKLCVNGQTDFANLVPALKECAGEAVCTLLRCIPDALCPPETPAGQFCAPPSNECMPCNFAVEEPAR